MTIFRKIGKLLYYVIIKHKYIKLLYLLMNLFIPRNKFGDYLYTYLDYFIYHRKIPSKNTMAYYIIHQKLSSDNFRLKKLTTDKYLAKKFLEKIKLQKYITPTIFFSNNLEKLFQFKLEKKHLKIIQKEKTNLIVIKPTNSQGRIIKKQIKLKQYLKDILTKEEAEKIIDWSKENYYISSRDCCYKNLKAGFIIEPLVDNQINIKDYKFHLYKNKLKVIQLDVDRNFNHRRNLYSEKFIKLNFSIGYKSTHKKYEKPKNLKNMIAVAKKIAKFFIYCRVDFYVKKDGNFYIGEITHHHGNGCEPFYDEKNNIVNDTKKEIKISKFFIDN